MENVEQVQPTGADQAIWTHQGAGRANGRRRNADHRGPAGRADCLALGRGSDIDTEGRVRFRDAGARGTIVETIIAYKPPGARWDR
jgi:hypothetical protein